MLLARGDCQNWRRPGSSSACGSRLRKKIENSLLMAAAALGINSSLEQHRDTCEGNDTSEGTPGGISESSARGEEKILRIAGREAK
jgi:hypothetical protein